MPKKNTAEPVVDPIEEPTEEQIAEWEGEADAQHEAGLEPYRAMARQQAEQDEILADLLFKDTMRELEG